jgi:cytochrome c oxidase subunit 2
MIGLMARLGTPLATGGGSFWMPKGTSTFAGEVDFVFQFVLWISIIFFVLIVALMVLFVARYRRPKGTKPEDSPHKHLPLELTWTIVPSILVIIIFYLGFRGYMNLITPPANAYEILVTGQKWKWLFTYPNGYVDESLHVPVDEDIRLVTSSEDVIHSLYIPQFRLKQDVVPGRYGNLWFRATDPGEYEIFCAEYCGTGHSDMLATVVVHPPGEFEKWLEDASNFLDRMSPVEAGKLLYSQRGCKQCHSIDGSAGTGPTFKGIWGTQRVLQDGSRVLFDENHVRESILDPQAQVLAGFDPVMPTFKGKLKDREITAIIAFLKSLKD